MSYDSGNTNGNNDKKNCFICEAVNSSPKKKNIGKLPLIILLVVVIGFILGLGMNRKTASSSDNTSASAESNTRQLSDGDETGEDDETIDDIDEVEEQTVGFSEKDFTKFEYMYYMQDLDNYLFFLSIKNNTGTSVAVSGDAIRKSEDGEILESKPVFFPVLGSGDEALDTFMPHSYEEGDKIEYDLHYEEADSDISLSDLDIEETVRNKHVTSLIQNPTDQDIYIQTYALFFDENDKVIDWSFQNNGMITYSGGEMALQSDCDEAFDHVKIFYVYFSSNDSSDRISEDSLDIVEKASAWIDDEYYHCLEITNLSSEEMEVSGNAIARDSDGHAVGGASDVAICLAPDQISLLVFRFDDLTEVDDISYSLNCQKTNLSYSAVYDTSLDYTKTSDGLKVCVTNERDEIIKPMVIKALFFNENMELIDFNCSPIYGNEDDHGALEPGETYTNEIHTSSDYVYEAVYYYPRRYAS